jgi:hypothetical protein
MQRGNAMRGRLTTGILVVLVGIVFVGQGTGLLRGSSFMVDDPRWAVIGAFLVVVGAVLSISALRSMRSLRT